MALLIVNANKGQRGKIHVAATADGLKQASTDLTAK
jgi:hypothetical protein